MKIQTGHKLTGDVKPIEADSVSFIAEDGRAMFEVMVGKDGRSIEVRGVQCCRVDGTLYAEGLIIRPICSNVVVVRTVEYDKKP